MKSFFFLTWFFVVPLLAGFVENLGKTDFMLPDVIVRDVTSQLIIPKQLNLKMINSRKINYHESNQYSGLYQIIRFNKTINSAFPFITPPEREVGYYPAFNDNVVLQNNEINSILSESKKSPVRSSVNINLLFLPIERFRLNFRYSQYKNHISSILYSFINVFSSNENPINIMSGLDWSRNMEGGIDLFNIDFSNSNVFNNSELKNSFSMNFLFLHRFYGYKTIISMDSRADSLFSWKLANTNAPNLQLNYWNQIELTNEQMPMPVVSNLTTGIWGMNGIPEYSVLLKAWLKLDNSLIGFSIAGDRGKHLIFPVIDAKLFDGKNSFDIYLDRLIRAFPYRGEAMLYLTTPLSGIPLEYVKILGIKYTAFANSKEELDLRFEHSSGNQNYFENDTLKYSDIQFYDIKLAYKYLWNDYDNFGLSLDIQVPGTTDFPHPNGPNILFRLNISRKPANLPFGYELETFMVHSAGAINNYEDFIELKDTFGGLSMKILSRGNENVNEKLTFTLNYKVKISKDFKFEFINIVSCGINY